jgi:hypothetical protein
MLAGYCWPQSGIGGESIDIAISSSTSSCRVEVIRVGVEEVVVTEFDGVSTSDQPVPSDAATNGCRWVTTLTVEIDPAWRSGYHLVRMHTGEGDVAEAFFVVRARQPGDTVLVLATSTYAAYNDWGGPSFYTGGHVSSQQRPLPRGFLDKPEPEKYRIARFGQLPAEDVRRYFADYSYWSAASGWANWERLFVEWAERVGLELDYATSLDLHQDPSLLNPYKLYVSVGHDEYWSAAMRDSVEGWVDRGGAAVFLSGNTSFWQIRYEGSDDDPEAANVVGYKNDMMLDPVVGTDEQHTVSTMWSDPYCKRPESEMTGVSFTPGGYAHMRSAPMGTGGYTVWRPDHWAFEALPLRAGDVVGSEPIVVGYECDGCEMTLVDGLPVAAGTGGTPTNFEVLGTAPAHLWETSEAAPGLPDTYIGELNWVTERLAGADTPENRERFAYGYAVMGAFSRGAGEVFTVGCTDWAYGLTDPAIDRITRNVVARHVKLAQS